MAMAESILPTSEMALAVNKEIMGKLFFCIIKKRMGPLKQQCSSHGGDQDDEDEHQLAATSVAVSKSFLQAIGLDLLQPLVDPFPGRFCSQAIIKHDKSP